MTVERNSSINQIKSITYKGGFTALFILIVILVISLLVLIFLRFTSQSQHASLFNQNSSGNQSSAELDAQKRDNQRANDVYLLQTKVEEFNPLVRSTHELPASGEAENLYVISPIK